MWMNFGGLALAIAAALALASAVEAEQKSWRHAIVVAKSDAGIVLMVTKGFAEKQGLKLEVTQVESDAIALKALLAGELDSFDGSPTGSMIAASRGADVKILGCGWPGLPSIPSWGCHSASSIGCSGNRSRPATSRARSISRKRPMTVRARQRCKLSRRNERARG